MDTKVATDVGMGRRGFAERGLQRWLKKTAAATTSLSVSDFFINGGPLLYKKKEIQRERERERVKANLAQVKFSVYYF